VAGIGSGMALVGLAWVLRPPAMDDCPSAR
jgi:hypothetical protein